MNFWRIGKVLWAITSRAHIFFSTPQNDLKKITHLNHDDMYLWKKNQDFWITFEHSNFNIPISAHVQSSAELDILHQFCQRCNFLKNCAILMIFFS